VQLILTAALELEYVDGVPPQADKFTMTADKDATKNKFFFISIFRDYLID
jgi:hypothetical protein